jgi:anthranilate 1,2-dioxygenase large subunit
MTVSPPINADATLDAPAFAWPRDDYSRVPYRVYHDPAIYARELDRVFRGAAWNLLGLDCEIPNPGDFRATWVGDTPVICNRDRDGVVHAFVNRCAHRGAMVRREAAGNAESHTCIYHQWCYALDGSLTSIPFRRGVKGKGGLDPRFDLGDHSLRRLKVDSVAGALFGTFSDSPEPLRDYLGPPVVAQIERLFQRPIRVLGYHRQRINGNWKLYAENTRDNYHASLLHDFLRTFGVDRVTQTGGVTMDARHRHNITWAEAASDTAAFADDMYNQANISNEAPRLRDRSVVAFRREHPDQLNLAVTSVFPNGVFVQINNSLATRQIRPKGVDSHEVFQTLIGYEDDDAETTAYRLRQANLVGPAGFVSMEDGEAIEIAHRASRPHIEGATVIEMGGGGPITDRDYRVTDVPLRGFWSYYAELMGFEPAGGVR